MSDERPGELIQGVIHDARELAVAEVDKLKAEAKTVGEKAKIAGLGIGLVNVAALLVGQALGFGLVALGLPAWAAFAIVAAAFAASGILFVKFPREVPA